MSGYRGSMRRGREKSRAGTTPNSVPIPGGGIRDTVNDDRGTTSVFCGGRNFYLETPKKDITSEAMIGTEAKVFSADGASGSQGNPLAVGAQDEHVRNEIDLFLSDWPELGSMEDFETDLRKFETEQRKYESPFITGSNFDDPASAWSLDIQFGHFDKPTDPEWSATNRIILEPTVSDPVSAHQQPFKSNEAPLDCDALASCSSSSSSSSWEHFPCMKKSRSATPDMVLDKIAENPVQMYFPQMATTMTTREQPPETLMNASSSAHMLLPPRGYFAGNDDVAHSSEGSSAESCERPRWMSVLETLPAQFSAFQKLQEGLDQLDMGTRTCISDALYRLATDVEERHRVHRQLAAGGSVGPSMRANSVRTQAQQEVCNPLDRPVAELLLPKPPEREKTNRRTNCDASW